MFTYSSALFATALTFPLSASTPPLQPVTGPGGSTYAYASVTVAGPFNDSPSCPGSDCNEGLTYYIYQPAAPVPTKPLPLILFLHGYSADDPSIYMSWIQHIVKNGFTVIWSNWDNNGTDGGDDVVANELISFQNAIARIQSDISYVQPALDPRGRIKAALAGHSGGAFTGFRLASLSWDPSNGIPPIKAIAAINPGQGNLPDYDVSDINPGTKIVVVVGADETTCEQYDGAKLYDLLSMVPSSSKSFLQAFTDNHGSPGLSSEHNFPATMAPLFPFDDMDFNISFKLSVALFDCAFYNVYCAVASAGSPEQVGMGWWSDSVPVTPLLYFTTDPQLTFPLTAAHGCTQ